MNIEEVCTNLENKNFPDPVYERSNEPILMKFNYIFDFFHFLELDMKCFLILKSSLGYSPFIGFSCIFFLRNFVPCSSSAIKLE